MLAVTLRGLEDAGLVTRTVYPTKPPAVEYRLTPPGRGLLSFLKDVARLARSYGVVDGSPENLRDPVTIPRSV